MRNIEDDFLKLACLLSDILGRVITHKQITKEEYLDQWSSIGYEELAEGLVDGELRVAQGSEEAIFRSGTRVIEGVVSLEDYIVKNKHLWMKAQGIRTSKAKRV